MLPNLFTHLPLQRTFLTTAMSKVSRSFALVVPWLEEPLQEQISTAYLLCRVLDNIEDCGQPFEWQKARFAEFTHLLAEPSAAPARLHQWEKMAWPGLTASEAELMSLEGGLPIWLIFASFPDHVRATCRDWISRMADGMEATVDPTQTNTMTWHDDIRLQTTVDSYNEYCYHVAGTVGGLGTELVIAHYHLSGRVAEHLMDGSISCGRALQKTNILKDFVEDLERHICYLPDEWLRETAYTPLKLGGAPLDWSYTVVQDVLAELRDATEYVRTIPAEAMGYRIASLVCLLPAYQTIASAARHHAQLFTKAHDIKINREMMARCLHEAASMAPDNDTISDHCHQLEQAICAEFLAEPVHT